MSLFLTACGQLRAKTSTYRSSGACIMSCVGWYDLKGVVPFVVANKRLFIIALGLFISTLTSCSGPNKADAWYEPLGENPEIGWTKLSETDFFVPTIERDVLSLRLKDDSFRVISLDELKVLRPDGFALPIDKIGVLVRGLTYSPKTGEFSVFEKDGAIAAANNSLGKSDKPMTRMPVIIFLKRAPTKVYVDCAMDE